MNDDYETPERSMLQAFGQEVKEAVPESITDEAQKIINGPRRDDYGPVEESFQQIATMWSALFGKEITSKDVALAMICLKVCRESGPKHTRDSLVDIVGYTLLLEKIEQGS